MSKMATDAMSATAEEWRAIPGYEGQYEVSSLGRVRSLLNTGRQPYPTPKILKGFLNNSGYERVYLNGNKRVHRLVLLAFVGPPPSDKHEAAHGNGKRSDNRLSNLRWATSKENKADTAMHGNVVRGEKHYLAKLTAEKVRDIRAAYKLDGLGIAALARRYGVAANTIRNIVCEGGWSHV